MFERKKERTRDMDSQDWDINRTSKIVVNFKEKTENIQYFFFRVL